MQVLICNALILYASRHGSKNVNLCRLPQKWLESVLGRLSGEQQQQVFILRRSAGFAYSFLALLRAEPLNCAPQLLPLAMNSLLNTVRLGLADAQNYVDGTDGEPRPLFPLAYRLSRKHCTTVVLCR
jgi:hypothetical protein